MHRSIAGVCLSIGPRGCILRGGALLKKKSHMRDRRADRNENVMKKRGHACVEGIPEGKTSKQQQKRREVTELESS